MSQPKVFISYRRSDSQAQTGRLYDRLNRAFPGMFFRDVSEIGVGVDFVAHVERAVGASVALIAVIGPDWTKAADERGRRLDDTNDFVRVEIRTALARKIRIIPVLVGDAEMVSEDELPEDLRPFSRWNAIRIVEDYYDEAIDKLVRSLVPELGEPASKDNAPQADAKTRSLRGEAEAAIGVEDWFGAIQALQAALSLEPNNFEISARLKWANEQRKLSGLFTEGQELYDRGKKAAALQKFRQVRVAGGNYRGVNELMAQIEGEVTTDSRRSSMRRWGFGAAAAVVGVVAIVGVLFALALRQEFGGLDGGDSSAITNGGVRPTSAADPKSASGTGAPPPAADAPRRTPMADPPAARSVAGFSPVGRYRAVQHDNQQIAFGLALNPDSTFQVQATAGIYNVPLSGGSFSYNPSSGVLQLAGMNNLGGVFSEPMQIYEAHEEHFHAMYAGVRWDLFPE